MHRPPSTAAGEGVAEFATDRVRCMVGPRRGPSVDGCCPRAGFPALMDYYATTAKANDSFIGGVAGAGQVKVCLTALH